MSDQQKTEMDHAELGRLAEAALDAFDRLYGCVIGIASEDAIREHFGTRCAFEIKVAKHDADRTRTFLQSIARETGK